MKSPGLERVRDFFMGSFVPIMLGNYFYKLQTMGFVKHKKLTLYARELVFYMEYSPIDRIALITYVDLI